MCMQEQNRSSWEYFKTKERFADLLNGYVYHGIQEIREEDITDSDVIYKRIGSIKTIYPNRRRKIQYV